MKYHWEFNISKIKSLYIHYPFCRHLCNYCDFHKKVPTHHSDEDNFQKYLERSINVHQNLLNENDSSFAKLDTLYIGGGTPSLWGKKGISFLLDLLEKNNIYFEDDYEFTIELNPGSWNKNDLIELKKMGVNRISVGVQSLTETTLKALDRIHSLRDVHRTLESLADLNFNYSVDFMLGLPKEKTGPRDIISEVQNILKYEPSHLSSYILTVNKNYIHYTDLPDENFVADEFLSLSSYMTNNGFDHYEVSNFSKSNLRSRHNLKYWRGESVAALGPSATGFIELGNSNGLRYKWKTIDLPNFSQELISENEYKLERFFLKLRISDGVDLTEFIKTENLQEAMLFIDQLSKSGHLLSNDPKKLVLSPLGYLSSDSITTRFLSLFK